MSGRSFASLAAAVLVLGAGTEGARGDLIITEILASNTAYVTDLDQTPDLVEIYNTGPDDVTLSGTGTGNRMYLTDDPYGDHRRWWKFPLTTVLKAGEYLSVACDMSGLSGLHANFRIEKSKGVVALMDRDTNGRQIIDMVEYHDQYPNVSYARFERGDGTHVWHYTSRPTFFWAGKVLCATESPLKASPLYCGNPAELCSSSPVNIIEEIFIPDIDGLDYRPALPKSTDDVVVEARLGPTQDRVALELH